MKDVVFYRNILEHIAEPVICNEAVRQNGIIVDFRIIYENPAYKVSSCNFLRIGDTYSSQKEKLAKNIDWMKCGTETIESGHTIEFDFCSPHSHHWYHLSQTDAGSDIIVTTLTDISVEKVKDKALEFLGDSDLLTGLKNRGCFYANLNAEIVSALEKQTKLGIAIINIDDLKTVNNTAGYADGDAIIKKGARLLVAFETKNLTAYRLGSDEYAILDSSCTGADGMLALCRKITDVFAENEISVSTGISVCPDQETQASFLMKYADLALRSVKKREKGGTAVFTSDLYNSFINHLQLIKKIDIAISNRYFKLFYQPQYDLESRQLRGFEALIRWHDGLHGWYAPEEFIPVAEESKAIVSIGDWVLEEAVATLARWQKMYRYTGTISVNVSPVQLRTGSFCENVVKVLEKYKVEPRCLELEITEGKMVNNLRRTCSQLNELHSKGVSIALDDFGTGFSSLHYLHEMPLSTIKLDKNFTDKLNTENDLGVNIISSVVTLISRQGVNTIAEGVEHKEQVEILKNMKCSYIQGFLWGKPMPQEQCERYLAGDMSALDKMDE